MGKSRKYSKGHSSGFVPDYRRAAETMGESEGLGSSGRVDTEMTASEDSSAPKRKCISLNAESCDGYGVPVQVLSFSKMSHIERKNLEMRLKMELEQVRLLQNKIASLSSNVVLSPSSDIRSCNDGQKRIPIESFHRSSEIVGSQGKKRLPPGRNSARTKKNISGRFEPVKPAVPANTSNAVLMKQCETLLNRLMQHQCGWVFNTPVDVVKLNIPDYVTVIKHPMDLGTIKNKIVSGQYSSPLGFAADVRLTFSNATTYNPPGNNVHVMAQTLSKFFEVRWKSIEKKLPVNIDTITVPSRASVYIENETDINFLSSKMKKINPNDTKIKSEPVKQIMTDQEKHNLSTELEALTEFPENIVDFLKEHSFSEGLTDGEEIEIDIYALNDETLFKLRELLDDFLLEKKKAKAEPCEMELLNESGFSNSSIPPCKGNDQGDEDIDIVGGNDCPISSYPPVEIEKDAANRNNKGISSSSSSSESGSSRSDSDSGSSSSSESDAAKASATDNLIPGENLDQKKGDAGVLDIRNQSLNKLNQVELNSQGQPIAGADGNQEVGESAPSGRQVSPEKRYRAALLRNRFAETIFKARKKALEKGEKQDPEKLRIEKEELERRHREDLARIQAEAKAAEEAKRKAEAEEVRRKIEQEREAQRQALLKMEKTVDINENSQFMEDLEMLRATNDEHLPSFNEETSPDHSQNGLGSFKLQGNPLEQLGLYMKVDEEEEDDDNGDAEPPLSFPEPANDRELGEID
ncbi:hypothetical protein SLEP1_g17450 [Rubroshorea leprosula]|uniref:Transcription factor GTE10-like n=1 Tax=Rubroshorea leprosula TaxID=152421 RepID=A0AAV5J3J6_9ROSI|nr:hypothetical protein SLEP1_g17450 [Rubroshorea leprosula]